MKNLLLKFKLGLNDPAYNFVIQSAPFDGGTEIELRPVFEMDDFAASMTPELREQEEQLRAQLGRK